VELAADRGAVEPLPRETSVLVYAPSMAENSTM
jgi:hypothetical protein